MTDRFHAVCLAVRSNTPFIAIASNSWEIEALTNDIGPDPMRLCSPGDLTQSTLGERNWTYSDAEKRAIADTLLDWRAKPAMMFDDIVALQLPRNI